jgi:hypothetical protein
MNVTQEEILSLFGKKISLESLECSIILQSQDEEKKKLAIGILEIMTGQCPFISKCNPILEDPHFLRLTVKEKKEVESTRGRLLSQKNTKLSRNDKTLGRDMTPRELKRIDFGTKMKVNVRNVNLYSFLEKLREFYLPETISKKLIDYNSLETKELKKYFTSMESKEDRKPIDKMKTEFLATKYVLKSTDLLKFPDLELHFQHLNSLIGLDEKQSKRTEEPIKNKSLTLIIAPYLKITSPLKKESHISEEYCNMKLYNYLLSQIFNPYSERILSG